MTVPNKKVLVLGIGGATCSGKTTIAMELNKILPNATIFCQDDYYYPVEDPRHVWIPELNHINFDILSSLDMEQMVLDIKKQIDEETYKIQAPAKLQNGTVIHEFQSKKFENLFQIKESQVHIVIVEGFCIFNHKPLADLCDLKYYFTLDYDECFRRRMKRVYEPPDCPGYFEKCAWPEHLQQIAEVREQVKDVVYFDGNSTNHSERILNDIVKVLRF